MKGRRVKWGGPKQLSLFSAARPAMPAGLRGAGDEDADPSSLDDGALAAALAAAGPGRRTVLIAEAGRRRSPALVPALAEICARYRDLDGRQAYAGQIAAFAALAAIGGSTAKEAVARIVSKGGAAGPNLVAAMEAAVRLAVVLPGEVLASLLHHGDPLVRAAACRLVPANASKLAPVLVELLGDLHPDIANAAACALGRLGREEGRARLLSLLAEAPDDAVIDALEAILDETVIIHLGRVAGIRPDLAAQIRDVLAASDQPQAERVLDALAPDAA